LPAFDGERAPLPCPVPLPHAAGALGPASSANVTTRRNRSGATSRTLNHRPRRLRRSQARGTSASTIATPSTRRCWPGGRAPRPVRRPAKGSRPRRRGMRVGVLRMASLGLHGVAPGTPEAAREVEGTKKLRFEGLRRPGPPGAQKSPRCLQAPGARKRPGRCPVSRRPRRRHRTGAVLSLSRCGRGSSGNSCFAATPACGLASGRTGSPGDSLCGAPER
jgi:hypothetical protein